MQVRPSAFAVPATAQQPTDLPDGPSRRFRVQCHQQKYFASQPGRNSFIDSAVPPQTSIAIVTDAGCGCGGRGSVLRAMGSQGGFLGTCERYPARGRKTLFADGKIVWS